MVDKRIQFKEVILDGIGQENQGLDVRTEVKRREDTFDALKR